MIFLKIIRGFLSALPYFVASGKSSPGTFAPQLLTGVVTNSDGKYPDFPRVGCVLNLCSIAYAGTNQLTSEWIKNRHYAQHLGIVVADFPGARLIDRIIKNNNNTLPDSSRIDTLKSIILFEDGNFKGNRLAVMSNRTNLELFNKKMSSFLIPKGWSVRFYTEPNFKGEYFTRDSNSEDKAFAETFNDEVQSVKVMSFGPQSHNRNADGLVIYDSANFSGDKRIINESVADLKEFNNKLTSYTLPDNWEVRFYEGKNYSGNYYTRTNRLLPDQEFVKGFNNTVESIKILKKPGGSQDTAASEADLSKAALVLYTEPNHKGESLRILESMPTLGLFNNKAQSYTLPDKWRVRFFTSENYVGDYYTRNIGHTGDSDFMRGYNKAVKSVQILSKDWASDKGNPNRNLIIYENADFQGKSMDISHNTPSLGSFDKKMSSYTMPKGWKVRFYEGKNYTGSYYTRDYNAGDSGFTEGYNDAIQSIKIMSRPD